MGFEGIREALHRQPFRPFVICLVDGRRLPVTHPDSIAVGKHRTFVIAPDDSYSSVEPPLIASLDYDPEDIPRVWSKKEKTEALCNSASQMGDSRMAKACGVDGCRAGWIALTLETMSREVEARQFDTFTELVNHRPASTIIAIDIPIGLPDRGQRLCDQEARQLLGRPRGSSVFRAPIRATLSARSYRKACQIGCAIDGKGLSLQTWAIMPKIREVNEHLREHNALRSRIREVHPEVCFYHLAGNQPMQSNKRHVVGQQERRILLERVFGAEVGRVLAQRRELHCTKDDILDAFAALWTAERVVNGQSVTLPANPPSDAFGLRMEIIA